MNIGLIKEIKNHEYRVGLTPDSVQLFTKQNHKVFVEYDAGIGAGFSNKEYLDVGAIIVKDKQKIFDDSEMIIKVKEPLAEEYKYFHEKQILYTYLHLAADRPLTDLLIQKKIKAVAYETITGPNNSLPCLMPMSEIAGRMSIQEGAKYLEKPMGGRGVLLGGVPGVTRGNVVIIGGGIVGANACKMAIGLGANVTILDISHHRLVYLDDIFGTHVTSLYANRTNILYSIAEADLVVGAVLIPGGAAPKLISKDDLQLMKPNSVLVDVAIDQGGCIETSKPTSHDDPIFFINDILHYCVTNMPAAVSLTSTLALNSTTVDYGLAIANKGLEQALADNAHLKNGLNTYDGFCVNQAVAQSLSLQYHEVDF